MAPIDFVFTRSNVKVTSLTFVNKMEEPVFAHYLKNYLSHSFYILRDAWSWMRNDPYCFSDY